MPFSWDGEHLAIALSIACHAALLWHLYYRRLLRYVFLKALLAVELAQSLLLLPFSPSTKLYGDIYFLTSPVIWLFFYLVLTELVRFILADFSGISVVVRKGFSFALIAAILLATVVTLPGLHGPAQFRILETFVVVQRFVILVLLLLLVLMLGILFYFRVPLSPNRKRYAVGYALYFAVGVAANLLVFELGFKSAPQLSLWLVSAASCILFSGVFALRRDGEIAPAPAESSEADRAARQELHRQLASLNQVLSKTSGANSSSLRR